MASFTGYPSHSIEKLVKSLDRKEDEYLFSKDVLLTHPHLAEVYTSTCPVRCDLTTAARKAVSGAYSEDPNLSRLRDDLQLMVDNCIRFNGQDSPLAEIARKFMAFATQQVNAFIAQYSSTTTITTTNNSGGGGKAGASSASYTRTTSVVHSSGGRSVERTPPSSSHLASMSSFTSTVLPPPPPPPRRKEVEDLLIALRRQYEEFAVDVTEAYPELKQKYLEVCPRVMHLGRMVEKARAGVYTEEDPTVSPNSHSSRPPSRTFSAGGRGSSSSPHRGRHGHGAGGRGGGGGGSSTTSPSSSSSVCWGTTIVACLPLLRQDVELIVRNCLVFNAGLEKWERLARQFQQHAHRAIDGLVRKRYPALQGTLTGEEHYYTTAVRNGGWSTSTSPNALGEDSAAARSIESFPSSEIAPPSSSLTHPSFSNPTPSPRRMESTTQAASPMNDRWHQVSASSTRDTTSRDGLDASTRTARLKEEDEERASGSTMLRKRERDLDVEGGGSSGGIGGGTGRGKRGRPAGYTTPPPSVSSTSTRTWESFASAGGEEEEYITSTSVPSSSSSSLASNLLRKKTVKWEEGSNDGTTQMSTGAPASAVAGTSSLSSSLSTSPSSFVFHSPGAVPPFVRMEEDAEVEEENGEDGTPAKRHRGEGIEDPWHPHGRVTPMVYVTPNPTPSVVQPVFHIPSRLRDRIMKDYLSRYTLHPRIIGETRCDTDVEEDADDEKEDALAEKKHTVAHGNAIEEVPTIRVPAPHPTALMPGRGGRLSSPEEATKLALPSRREGTGEEVMETEASTGTSLQKKEEHRKGQEKKEFTTSAVASSSVPLPGLEGSPKPREDASNDGEKEKTVPDSNVKGKAQSTLLLPFSIPPPAPKKKKPFTPAHSAAAVLQAFETHIHHLFTHQRHESTMVENAFRFTRQEEQIFMDVIRMLRIQFNRLFLSLLVYENEMIEFRRYAASQCLPPWILLHAGAAVPPPSPVPPSLAIQEAVSKTSFSTATTGKPVDPVSFTPSTSAVGEDRGAGVIATGNTNASFLCSSSPVVAFSSSSPMVDWLSVVHYCYIIRLAIQFPQLVALSCCTTEEAKDGLTALVGSSQPTMVAIDVSSSSASVSSSSAPGAPTGGIRIEKPGTVKSEFSSSTSNSSVPPSRPPGSGKASPARVFPPTSRMSDLVFPRSAKGLLAHVCHVIEEFLSFADQYERLLQEVKETS